MRGRFGRFALGAFPLDELATIGTRETGIGAALAPDPPVTKPPGTPPAAAPVRGSADPAADPPPAGLRSIRPSAPAGVLAVAALSLADCTVCVTCETGAALGAGAGAEGELVVVGNVGWVREATAAS